MGIHLKQGIMKYLYSMLFAITSGALFGQTSNSPELGERVVLENEELKVVEYVCLPQGDNVCGSSMHHHAPHLTVVLEDAKVTIKSESGDTQEIDLKAGMAVWFEEETHAVVNKGDLPSKMLLIFPKKE
jgi:quercetin dioxygenase-like cupin family protein